MNCAEVKPILEQMLDEQIPAERMFPVFQHIQECAACESKYSINLSLRQRMQTFRSAIVAPQTLVGKIKDSLKADAEPPAPVSDLAQDLLREDIVAIMARLSPRERDVLRIRFGLDDGKQRSIEEVAELYGLSPERVRQIEAKALRKLRSENNSDRSPPMLR